ncbi:MAG TPA: hypothetical protein VFI99_07485 [Nocardioides sp.]|nr:hypothetical protein [Nocardioides sp.]
MTDHTTTPTSSPSAEIGPGDRPSVLRVLRDQRKTVVLAAVLMAGTYWVAGQLGEWRLAACIAGGIALGLLNHLVTEYWLMRIITSGEQPTRNKMIASTMTRLLVLTLVAVGIAVMFWPDGIGLLLGLALFRLIALVMTGLPLLKELKNP